MVGTTPIIKPLIIPLAEIARLPNWYAVSYTIFHGVFTGAGKPRQIEFVPFSIAERDVFCEGTDAVKAGLVVVAVDQVGLNGFSM